MILEKFDKQPWEEKDYDVNFLPWLKTMTTVDDRREQDILSDVDGTVVCTSDPSDTSMTLTKIEFTASRAKFWIAGGTSGNKYKLTIRVTTVGGRKDESELVFKLKDQ